MRKLILHNIVAVASYCPVPSVARYARVIRFGDGHTSYKDGQVNATADAMSCTHVSEASSAQSN